MKLKTFKAIINELPDSMLDSDILVDTEGAEFTVHLVQITGIYTMDKEMFGRDIIYLSLDHDVKIHRCNLEV